MSLSAQPRLGSGSLALVLGGEGAQPASHTAGQHWASKFCGVALLLGSLSSPLASAQEKPEPLCISGRYPHLTMFNHNGECGVGAVVPWADRLWVITYGPHLPKGSDDKLYEIDADLHRITRPESVGGTPADRMIHDKSNQLIIGPYFIDSARNVRVIPPTTMPGRLTAVAEHLTDPDNKVYILDMEGTLYEANVHTLESHRIFQRVAPGAHGKGGYTGQGHFIMANNGNEVVNKAKPALVDDGYKADPEASGILAEWDGQTWSTIARRQFTDITGPGGIHGAKSKDDPVWAIGWDKRSILLKVRDHDAWQTYRLPIADDSYVARHGWYTEWPRIREVTDGKFLLNMHGGWFEFPRDFAPGHVGGIRPIGSYLKITGDFAPWNGRIVFGCDDGSVMENPLLGQSQSNLWFTTWQGLQQCGRPCGTGSVWMDESIEPGKTSDPFLLAGYDARTVHLSQTGGEGVKFTLELDQTGAGAFEPWKTIDVAAGADNWLTIPATVNAPWIRVKSNVACRATAVFTYGPGGGAVSRPELFAALADIAPQGTPITAPAVGSASADAVGKSDPSTQQQAIASAKADPTSIAARQPTVSQVPAPTSPGDTLRPLGGDKGTLLFQSHGIGADGKPAAISFEVGGDLAFAPYAGPAIDEPTTLGAAKGYAVSQDDKSVIITDGVGRYRLPIGVADHGAGQSAVRTLREVVTERFLLNAGGSFFMVPRPTAGGAMRLKPVCTHGKRITDFCSFRGLMVLAGCNIAARADAHYRDFEGGPGLWFGDIDDLWSMGKPRGEGSPWLRTPVKAGQPSDPYLMDGYDRKSVVLSHDGAGVVHFSIEVDVDASGSWRLLKTIDVPAGTVEYVFPEGYSAHWVRLKTDADCFATARFKYE